MGMRTATGVVVASRDEPGSIVGKRLAGGDLVARLLEERRSSAPRDDHAWTSLTPPH